MRLKKRWLALPAVLVLGGVGQAIKPHPPATLEQLVQQQRRSVAAYDASLAQYRQLQALRRSVAASERQMGARR